MSADELLIELKARGVSLEVDGDRLRVDAPKGAVTPELREALAAHKAEVLALLTITEDEIDWRVKAMLPQVPASGAIPFLVARPDSKSEAGYCLSCGEWLKQGEPNRCTLCNRAANKALDLAMSKI